MCFFFFNLVPTNVYFGLFYLGFTFDLFLEQIFGLQSEKLKFVLFKIKIFLKFKHSLLSLKGVRIDNLKFDCQEKMAHLFNLKYAYITKNIISHMVYLKHLFIY